MIMVLILYILIFTVVLALCKAASKADKNIEKLQEDDDLTFQEKTK